MCQPQNTLMVFQNTLTLPGVSVEEHGRIIERRDVDVPATEHFDCISKHLDRIAEHLDSVTQHLHNT